MRFQLEFKFEEHNAALYAVAYDAVRKRLYTGGGDKIVASWDLQEKKNAPFSIKTGSAILTLKLLDDNRLFVGLFNGDFHIIDLEKNQELHYFPYHKAGIFSAEVIQNKLVLGSGDGTISIWDANTMSLLHSEKISEGKVRAITKIHDKVAIGTSEGKILIMDIDQPSNKTVLHTTESGIFCMKFFKEKDALIYGTKNAHLGVLSMSKKQEILSIPAHNWPFYSIEFIGDGFFATCSRDKIIKIWDSNKLEVVQRLCHPEFRAHINSINNLCYIPEIGKMISVGDDKRICIWGEA